jgi:hypothetical protein
MPRWTESRFRLGMSVVLRCRVAPPAPRHAKRRGSLGVYNLRFMLHRLPARGREPSGKRENGGRVT